MSQSFRTNNPYNLDAKYNNLMTRDEVPSGEWDDFINGIKNNNSALNKYLEHIIGSGYVKKNIDTVDKFLSYSPEVVEKFSPYTLLRTLDAEIIELFIKYGFKFGPDFNSFYYVMHFANTVRRENINSYKDIVGNIIDVDIQEKCKNIMNMLISYGFDIHKDKEMAMFSCRTCTMLEFF